jgi:NAD(P)H-hydrate epimerase
MRATDAAAIAAGVPGTQLMAAAGEAVAHVVRVRYPAARRVVCVCGGGANGGDGLVAARRLRALGVDASCLVVASRPFEGDALDASESAVAAGVPVSRVGAVGEGLRGADIVVDALLGTGRSGEPRGAVADAIRAIGAAGVPVVAVDVASGLDASTGEVADVAVVADVTVTFHASKIGHVILPGRAHTGALVVVPIGIPASVAVPAPATLADAATIAALGGRQAFGSKYDAGNVLAIGGSRGMTGAIVLCSRAALRAGAGLVVAAVPASQQPVVAGLALEPMTFACPDLEEGGLAPAAADGLLQRARRAAAVSLGPGCGRQGGTADLVRLIVPQIAAPLVLDADGLHAIGTDLDLLLAREAPTVITPHAGEAARLLGVTTAEVAAHRLASARTLAERTGAVCVLKGADTIIAHPDGRLAVREGDDPRLATAGTGDVLCGTNAGLLARGAPAFLAAAAGTAAHLAAARSVPAGRALVASDLIDRLPLGG